MIKVKYFNDNLNSQFSFEGAIMSKKSSFIKKTFSQYSLLSDNEKMHYLLSIRQSMILSRNFIHSTLELLDAKIFDLSLEIKNKEYIKYSFFHCNSIDELLKRVNYSKNEMRY